MLQIRSFTSKLAVALAIASVSQLAASHGDVTPQAVDVTTLKPLGAKVLSENPYRGDKEAIRVGSSAYNQNCARCHGLEAISGGIAPDLRLLDRDCTGLADKQKQAACKKEIDEYYYSSTVRGKVRNNAVYMPPYEGILSQEAIWAIKAYLETRGDK
jgi:cytochrome c-550 PedF